jgi:hypothetical protein
MAYYRVSTKVNNITNITTQDITKETQTQTKERAKQRKMDQFRFLTLIHELLKISVVRNCICG